jgi:probable F420-dependent oxidoreductase
MKLGVFVGFGTRTPPELIACTGRVAEERGLHSLWAPEHVLVFRDYDSRYPYSADGRIPFGPMGLMDPFDVLHFLCGITSRIRLGTGICIVPQRNPVYTAKHVADLDFLSGGRVDFGVGIGWLREEFEALGVPFERRAARTRDYLELMRRLWSEGAAPSYDGEFHRLPDCVFGPLPVQQPHPPIYVAGNSKPALRRTAELGQGWYGHDLDPESAATCLKTLDAFLAERDRRPDEVQRLVSPFFRPVDAAALARYRDLGADQVVLPLVAADADGIERRGDELAALAREVA